MGEQTNTSAFDSWPGVKLLQSLVRQAGAEWCGIQDTIDPSVSLLMFTSRETGSTLSVKFNPSGFNGTEVFKAVLAKIAESNAGFADRPVSVKASVLKDLSNRLMQLVNEVDALYLRSEKCPTPRPSKKS